MDLDEAARANTKRSDPSLLFHVQSASTASLLHYTNKTSMKREIQAGLQEIRPGRTLFVREWILTSDDGAAKGKTTAATAEEYDVQLLFVHGSCATELQFHRLCSSLSEKLSEGTTIRCIMYDSLGCGQSSVVSDWNAYATTELQHDFGAILERYFVMNQNTPLYVCCHSYAPNIVLPWINQHQESSSSSSSFLNNLQGFIFLGTSIRIDDNLPYPDQGHPIFRLPVWVLRCLQSSMTKDFVEKAVVDESLKAEFLMASDANDMAMVQAFYRQTRWMRREEFRQAMGVSLSSPPYRVLQIHGVHDQIIPIEHGQATFNQLLSSSSDDKPPSDFQFIAVEGASHMVMIEKADEVADHVQKFLKL